MKKLIIAVMGLSLLTGSALIAQNTSTDTATKAKKMKKKKKSTATDTMSAPK